jgi:RNA polymerase sigma-70 factor (ECF subfamily)
MTNTEFGTAYEKGFHRTVCFLASRGLPDPEAQEIAQAAWSRGWERRCQLRDQGMIFSWINSIALNMSRNQFRRNARSQGLEETVDLRPGPSSASASADIDHLFSKCDKIDRSLLWMQAVGGFTTAEIGKHHGLKPSTVRVRLMRAKTRLRQQSRRRGVCTTGTSRRMRHTVSV